MQITRPSRACRAPGKPRNQRPFEVAGRLTIVDKGPGPGERAAGEGYLPFQGVGPIPDGRRTGSGTTCRGAGAVVSAGPGSEVGRVAL